VSASGIALGAIAAPATAATRRSPLDETLNTLEVLGPLPEQMSVHLNRGYDSETTREKQGGGQRAHGRYQGVACTKGRYSTLLRLPLLRTELRSRRDEV
jgi:hypothetical protein